MHSVTSLERGAGKNHGESKYINKIQKKHGTVVPQKSTISSAIIPQKHTKSKTHIANKSA